MTEGTQEQVESEAKRCATCKVEKPRSEFDRCRAARDKLAYSCKSCLSEKKRISRNSDPNYLKRVREHRHRREAILTEDERFWLKMWNRYKLTKERYEFILARQGGGCAGCGGKGPFHVDHDHSCCPKQCCGDCVRGLLCAGCNWGDRLRRR